MSEIVSANDVVQLAEAPQIAGLTFRKFRGEQDYEAMTAIIQACKDTDGIERVDTVDDVRRNYSHLVNCDPYQDMLFAEVAGQPVGYNRVFWRDEIGENRIYAIIGFLSPEWRRQGIGTVMLRHAELRVKEINQTHPTDQPKYYELFIADTERGTLALAEKEGFSPVRHFFIMVRADLENVSALTLPDGVEIRPVTPEHYQKIYDASLEAFRDHWGFSEEAEEPLEMWLENPNFDPSLWQVAWDGSEVVGMVQTYVDRRENEEYGRLRGWTENIFVRKPWRKQGVASALIAASLKDLKQRGLQEAALGVDSQNLSGALQVYERLGYRQVKRSSVYRKALA